MFIDDSLIQRNQDIINFFNADAMFDELHKFLDKYGYDYVFNRDFSSDEELIRNYCVRSHVVKLAMDACEHYCKAILIQNGLSWNDMKDAGHNLLRAYNLLDDEDKNIIKNTIFFNRSQTIPRLFGFTKIMQIYIEDSLKSEKLENLSFEDILSSFSSGRVLPNIKSRYPGQAMIDYDEKFIVAYAYILHELCYKYKTKREFFENRNNLGK